MIASSALSAARSRAATFQASAPADQVDEVPLEPRFHEVLRMAIAMSRAAHRGAPKTASLAFTACVHRRRDRDKPHNVTTVAAARKLAGFSEPPPPHTTSSLTDSGTDPPAPGVYELPASGPHPFQKAHASSRSQVLG